MERLAFTWLDDEQLAKHVEELRERAHDAKLQNCAARAEDWLKASQELDRRKR